MFNLNDSPVPSGETPFVVDLLLFLVGTFLDPSFVRSSSFPFVVQGLRRTSSLTRSMSVEVYSDSSLRFGLVGPGTSDFGPRVTS